MKVGDLIKDVEAPDIGYGTVIDVKEYVMNGKLMACTIESYWPKLHGTYASIKKNNTQEPWFSLETINENR